MAHQEHKAGFVMFFFFPLQRQKNLSSNSLVNLHNIKSIAVIMPCKNFTPVSCCLPLGGTGSTVKLHTPRQSLFGKMCNAAQNHLITELCGRWLPGGHHPETRKQEVPPFKGPQQCNQVCNLSWKSSTLWKQKQRTRNFFAAFPRTLWQTSQSSSYHLV